MEFIFLPALLVLSNFLVLVWTHLVELRWSYIYIYTLCHCVCEWSLPCSSNLLICLSSCDWTSYRPCKAKHHRVILFDLICLICVILLYFLKYIFFFPSYWKFSSELFRIPFVSVLLFSCYIHLVILDLTLCIQEIQIRGGIQFFYS